MPCADPRSLTLMRDVLAMQLHTPGIGPQHATYQVDQSSLTRPIGSDQGHTLACVQGQRHPLRHMQATEVLVQSLDAEHGRTHEEAPGRERPSSRRNHGPGGASTTSMRASPMTNSQ